MIELNGSYGEGGGALVRVALALSTITGQEFKVTNIRAGREQGGLKAQHLTAIKALKEFCHAETNEVQLGSTELWFKPGQIRRGRYTLDIGTAGSISLLLQALLLPSILAPGKVTFVITGGTCGKGQASVDYFRDVFLPYVERFAEKSTVKVLKRGYYPEGGGEVIVEITPKFNSIQEINGEPFHLLEQGTLQQIRGIVNLSLELEEKKVGERIRGAVETSLRSYNVPMSIRVEYAKTLSIGGEVVVWGVFDNHTVIGADALLEKGKTSEEAGKEAGQKLRAEITGGFPVDSHLADQLIPFMGLLPGSSMIVREITEHTRTNIYVTEQFLPVRFVIEKKKIMVLENKDLLKRHI